ncbi:MAG: hypothetical protein AB1331_06260 [Bacillota bacterium]
MSRYYSPLADTLTALRFLLGASLPVIGITRAALPLVTIVLLHLAGLTTDMLGGALARVLPPGQGQLGRYDLAVDHLVRYLGAESEWATELPDANEAVTLLNKSFLSTVWCKVTQYRPNT